MTKLKPLRFSSRARLQEIDDLEDAAELRKEKLERALAWMRRSDSRQRPLLDPRPLADGIPSPCTHDYPDWVASCPVCGEEL